MVLVPVIYFVFDLGQLSRDIVSSYDTVFSLCVQRHDLGRH